VCGQTAQAADPDALDSEINTGNDLTRPLTRVDVRLMYQEMPGDRERAVYKLRGDRPVRLGAGWKLALRLDVPVWDTNGGVSANPSGAYHVGLGDVQTQVLLTHEINSRLAFGFGTQIIVPTAGDRLLGTGKLQMLPTAGYRYALPEISDGSFATFGMRYDVDVAGPDGRRHISNLQFAPTFSVALLRDVFVTFYPNSSIRYNFVTRSWFVPFDMQVGKLWGKSIMTSVEGFVPMYRGVSPLYDYRVELRVGFFY